MAGRHSSCVSLDSFVDPNAAGSVFGILVKCQKEIAQKLTTTLHGWRDKVDVKMPYPKTGTSKAATGSRIAKLYRLTSEG